MTWFDETVLAGTPDHQTAIRFTGGALSYGELRKHTSAWRERFAGFGPQDAVAVQVAPSLDYLFAVFGVLSTGAQLVLVDHRLTEAERTACLSGMRPRAMVIAPETGRITRFQPHREVDYTESPATGWTASPHRLVQFSSGATGRPKVIGRTEESLTSELKLFAGFTGWVGRGDVLLVLNSLAHSFGLIGAVLHSLRAGGTVAFAGRPLPKELLAAVEEFAPTAISGVPAHFGLLAALPRGSLDRVRVCVSGGELATEETYTRFAQRHRRMIGQSYGLTETGMLAGDAFGVTAPSVGWIAGDHQVRITDGLVEVALPDTPYLTAEASDRFSAGWLRTGDRGALDEHGVLALHGRADTLVVVGGLKVDLMEIERVLIAVPEVDDVVVLVTGGEIVANAGSAVGVSAQRLHAWCAERLAPYKVPSRFSVVPALGRTPTGKLLRRTEEHG